LQIASLQNDVFNNGTEEWVLIYNNAGGHVKLEAHSLLLFGSGLLSMGYGIRRHLPK
jgi:hypothetical protein